MLENKVEICNVHLPSDCVDKTWFPGPRNASDCNVHLHIFPSFHFTLKKVCSGIWVTKTILVNFLLKILCIFRFPIHSDRMAGNRAISSLLRTKVGLNNNKALLYWRVHVTKHSLPSCFCARHHTQKSFGLQSLFLRYTAENLQVTEYLYALSARANQIF